MQMPPSREEQFLESGSEQSLERLDRRELNVVLAMLTDTARTDEDGNELPAGDYTATTQKDEIRAAVRLLRKAHPEFGDMSLEEALEEQRAAREESEAEEDTDGEEEDAEESEAEEEEEVTAEEIASMSWDEIEEEFDVDRSEYQSREEFAGTVV